MEFSLRRLLRGQSCLSHLPVDHNFTMLRSSYYTLPPFTLCSRFHLIPCSMQGPAWLGLPYRWRSRARDTPSYRPARNWLRVVVQCNTISSERWRILKRSTSLIRITLALTTTQSASQLALPRNLHYMTRHIHTPGLAVRKSKWRSLGGTKSPDVSTGLGSASRATLRPKQANSNN